MFACDNNIQNIAENICRSIEITISILKHPVYTSTQCYVHLYGIDIILYSSVN